MVVPRAVVGRLMELYGFHHGDPSHCHHSGATRPSCPSRNYPHRRPSCEADRRSCGLGGIADPPSPDLIGCAAELHHQLVGRQRQARAKQQGRALQEWHRRALDEQPLVIAKADVEALLRHEPPLVGFRIKLSRMSDDDNPCHDNEAIVTAGKAMHRYGICCATCRRHRGWLSHRAAVLLTAARAVASHKMPSLYDGGEIGM
jgi:hypothetical protein